MKYKTMAETARKIFYADSFSGVNTADELFALKESQLSECVNLWNVNGVLSSRPGLCNSCVGLEKDPNSLASAMYEGEVNPVTVDGFKKIYALAEQYSEKVRFSAFLTDEENNIAKVIPLEIKRDTPYSWPELENAVFINDARICVSGVVLAVAINEQHQSGPRKRVEFYELGGEYYWAKINKEKFYTPVILADGRGDLFESAYDPEGLDPIKPRLLEEVNIVNGRFCAHFRVDGYSSKFQLPIKDLSAKPEDKLYVSIKYSSTGVDFTIAGDEDSAKQTFNGKEIVCNVDRKEGLIYFTENGKLYMVPYPASGRIYITGVKNVFGKDYDLFGSKTQSVLADTRLLRISAEESSNKIYYSRKEDPFYFCESNYFEVGGNSEPITAMAYQNRYLFAFKDNSIYRLKISDGEGYDIEKIISEGKKMPDTKPSLTVTKVHNTIGCDCPASVQFCQNRLVWYHSSGAVYSLYGTNTYTEGSVYTLSPNIRNMLEIPYEDIANVSACVKDGYYFLNYMNKIFVMDGNVSGFTYLSGSPQKDGGGGLNWFYWELPQNIRIKYIFSLSRELFAVYEGNRKNSYVSVARFGGEIDEVIIDESTSGVVNINVVFASALFGTKIKQKKELIKASMLFKGIRPTTFWVFSEEDTGSEFKAAPNGKLKRQNLIASSKNVFGAGIKMKTVAPVVIADIAFEFRTT